MIDPTLLTWLPATTWKFHRALIERLPDDRAAAALIGTLVEAARSQDILSVAVGVEREAQRAVLESLGCDALQGFLFAEPLAPDDFTRLLAAHAERRRSALTTRDRDATTRRLPTACDSVRPCAAHCSHTLIVCCTKSHPDIPNAPRGSSQF